MAQRRSLSKLLRIQPIRLKIEALGDPDVQRATDNGRYENLGALDNCGLSFYIQTQPGLSRIPAYGLAVKALQFRASISCGEPGCFIITSGPWKTLSKRKSARMKPMRAGLASGSKIGPMVENLVKTEHWWF